MLTHEFFAAIIDRRQGGPGVRPLMRAAGLSTESSGYRWGRAPLSDEDPDATGAVNLLDRFEAVARMLATYPRARWILLRLEAWTRALFDQLLRRDEIDVCDDELLSHLGDLAREHGETLGKCLKEPMDCDEALREALEDRDVLEQVIRILERRADHQTETVAMRRVG